MGRKPVNRRGKSSRTKRKTAFRSHDPELNKAVPVINKGRNSAPARDDKSVLKSNFEVGTVLPGDIPTASKPVVAKVKASSEADMAKKLRHEEMRRRGLEKKMLIAKIAPKPVDRDLPENEDSAEEEEMVSAFAHVDSKLERRKDSKKKDRKIDKDMTVTTPWNKLGSTSLPLSKYTEHKRKKMRERERLQRQKLREKKERKMGRVTPSSSSQSGKRADMGSSSYMMSDSTRELGLQLVAKLGKNRESLEKAYGAIGVVAQ